MAEDPLQTWHLTVAGRDHRVVVSGSMRHRASWYVGDELVAQESSLEEKLHLKAEDQPDLGAVVMRFGVLGTPRRATLFEPSDDGPPIELKELAGLGGLDLDPEPGSPAARHEERVRAHPRRYAVIQTAGGVAKVVVPILLLALLARFAFSFDLPSIPWPDLPDLPNLPVPDLPAIPWPNLPDLPDWSLPGWVRWILEHAKYVVPIAIAFGLAQAEIKRRRKQDELRADLRDQAASEQDEQDGGRG